MRKERKIINTNIRLNLCDEQDRQAWEYLQTIEYVLRQDKISEQLACLRLL